MCGLAYNRVSVGEGWFHRAERGLQSEPSAALPAWPFSHGYTTNTQTPLSHAVYNFTQRSYLRVVISHTSHCALSPVSCSRDQMLWIRPACSGWLLVFPHIHWCFCMRESYTSPAETNADRTVKNDVWSTQWLTAHYQDSGFISMVLNIGWFRSSRFSPPPDAK